MACIIPANDLINRVIRQFEEVVRFTEAVYRAGGYTPADMIPEELVPLFAACVELFGSTEPFYAGTPLHDEFLQHYRDMKEGLAPYLAPAG